MSWPVHIHPVAEADLREARDWYDQHRSGLGTEFMQAVEEALLALEAHPEHHPLSKRAGKSKIALRKEIRASVAI